MSDLRLRSATRIAAADASAEARAAWLKERLRAGTTTQDLIELAAYCGNPAAQLLLVPREDGVKNYAEDGKTLETACKSCKKEEGPGAIHSFAWAGRKGPSYAFCLRHWNEWHFDMWVCGLTRWHDALPGIAATVAAEMALPSWIEQHERRDAYPHTEDTDQGRFHMFTCPELSTNGATKCLTVQRVGQVVQAARKWVDCPSFPCLEHAEPCYRASAALLSDQPGFAAWLGLGIYHRDEDDGLNLFMQSIRSAVEILAGKHASGDLGAQEELSAAIRPAVIKWALRELS